MLLGDSSDLFVPLYDSRAHFVGFRTSSLCLLPPDQALIRIAYGLDALRSNNLRSCPEEVQELGRIFDDRFQKWTILLGGSLVAPQNFFCVPDHIFGPNQQKFPITFRNVFLHWLLFRTILHLAILWCSIEQTWTIVTFGANNHDLLRFVLFDGQEWRIHSAQPSAIVHFLHGHDPIAHFPLLLHCADEVGGDEICEWEKRLPFQSFLLRSLRRGGIQDWLSVEWWTRFGLGAHTNELAEKRNS